MKVLIVGAGAVGQVYGYFLRKGGCEVGFFVKQKYVETLKNYPMVLQEVGFISQGKQTFFKEYTLHTDFKDIKEINWDYIILTISITSFREGNWLNLFIGSIPKTTSLVLLSSSPEDRKMILDRGFEASRLLEGTITIMAWQAPLPNERFAPVQSSPNPNKSIGYLAQQPFPLSGNRSLCQPLIDVFSKGGLKAHYSSSSEKYFTMVALITPFLVALEAEQWSFNKLRSSSSLSLAASSIRESLIIASKRLNLFYVAWIRFFVWSWTLSLFLIFSRYAAPNDLEAFFQYHFTKVGDQTKVIYDEFIENGDKLKLSTKSMKQLATRNKRFSPN